MFKCYVKCIRIILFDLFLCDLTYGRRLWPTTIINTIGLIVTFMIVNEMMKDDCLYNQSAQDADSRQTEVEVLLVKQTRKCAY